MLKNWKVYLAILMVLTMVVTGFSACSDREGAVEDEISETDDDLDSEAEVEIEGELEAPELAVLAREKHELNEDTVGWLKVPNTTIDDVVLWKENDNDYYLRRDFEERYDFNGVYYADKRSTFKDGDRDGLARNTVIYGHSLDAAEDGDKFGPTRMFLDEEFAKENPYIYFSTLEEDMVWEVFAVFHTHYHLPYNRADLDDEAFLDMIDEAKSRSKYVYNVDISPEDKILTLSTCVYDGEIEDQPKIGYPNNYRYAVMARLVEPDSKKLEEADFVVNENIAPTDYTAAA